MNSLDGPECKHGHCLFNPTPCPKCAEETALFERTYPVLAALEQAESFISGFEGDETQEGIDELLAKIRKAIEIEQGCMK